MWEKVVLFMYDLNMNQHFDMASRRSTSLLN